MKKLYILLAFCVAHCMCNEPKGASLEDLINEIFTPTPPPKTGGGDQPYQPPPVVTQPNVNVSISNETVSLNLLLIAFVRMCSHAQ